MQKQYNPYANALDGLTIENPVQSFFNFCKERENIRLKRERGLPRPWSKDPIFQNGRFLNVFREDDRVSKSIFKFVDRLQCSLPELIRALFFARWCNRQEVIDHISKEIFMSSNKLKSFLYNFNDWCNENAYPVEKINWQDKVYSRIDAATLLFDLIKKDLTNMIIASNDSVIKATNEINIYFKMKNDFPIFMAVIDIAWFRPDIISPNSHVPTGIGAVAYLDRLQHYLGLNNHQDTCQKMIELQKSHWPESKRQFYPIDIEYLSCECRKYYSYVNGTKKFEGKNFFKPKK